MDEHFTAKEIETMKLIHNFRKSVGFGRIIIEFHANDIVNCEIYSKIKPTGITNDIDFAEKIFQIFLPDLIKPQNSDKI